MTTTVREAQTAPPAEPSPWLDIADELERIAADLRTLVGEPAPGLVAFDIQPHNADRGSGTVTVKNRPATIAAVDAVALALLGRPAKTEAVGSSAFHHRAGGSRGAIKVGVYTSVADPALVDPDEEIERLRAEVARLRAERTVDDESDSRSGWRDESTGLVSGGLVPNCPTCGGDHHAIEPCR